MENQLLIALSRSKLFRNIDISKIDLRDVKGKLITLGEGEILYREGDTAEIIFLLVSGQVNVLKKRLLGKTKSYLFREKDFFGHEEYFEETSRTSTAVALVDSYLIALNRDEMDSLIKQNDEILVNLKEPVPENFVEDLLRKEKEQTRKIRESEKQNEPIAKDEKEEVIRPTVVDEEKTMDFFKSISDFSRSHESNLIQPLELIEETPNHIELPEAEEKQPEVLPQETIIPEETTTLEKETEQENEISKPAEPFDENMFLNEDGIPKAEFELPDVPLRQEEVKEIEEVKPQEEVYEQYSPATQAEVREPEKENHFEEIVGGERKFDNGLDDALFQILSGGEVLNFEPTKENVIEEEVKTVEDDFPLQPVEETKEQVIEETSSQTEEKVEENISVPKAFEEPAREEEITAPKISQLDDFLFEKKKDANENVIVEEPVEAVNVFPEEYGAPEESVVPEPKKTELPNYILNVLEKIHSSVNLNEVLKNIAETSKILTSSDASLIFQIDWTKNEIWTLLETGFGKREIRFKVGDGVNGSTAKTGEVICINGINKEKRFNFDLEKNFCETAGSVLAFPIKNKKNEIVAILELIKKRPFEFSIEHEEKLKTLSVSFSNAIKNAELVDAIVKREREFSLSKLADFLEQEIKKPLLLSKRYAEHLKSKFLPQDVNNILNSLYEQVNTVTDVVTTTANYSQEKMPLRIVNVSLNNSLRDFSAKAEQFVESKFTQIINEFDIDTTVKMDVKEFYQCYMVMIKNACEAMPNGGKITVSTQQFDRKVEIHFKDNGGGIADEAKSKIFDPFFSEGKHEGTGIGLAVAKKIVEAHNGNIKVCSTIGEGADFIITLPMVSSF